ncbi:arylamine N-acetyltransferase family protein [Streptomyces johnsoniae]|uniref:Arylamine N-acetyltransferase n=1 Tax=Streptomyces johnsoniae TaxID=3075532 RepID=A0ABU2SEB9_9ACTN|nr:arylamine N-acetyltransferase [Streptomyces sp. DSM 41886]MDT0447153.1 arylamine N-acetyltransferase [Streptomyces sp. DSM 41886]
MLDDKTVAQYLERISAEPPGKPDADALRHLHERHVMSVPFDSIDYHLGAEIHMDERAIDKVVHQRRGGGCYEINTAFFLLLEALGFDITLHQGRLRIGDRSTPPYHHLLATVAIDGERWLVDIGFGKGSRHPLLLEAGRRQADPQGEFTLRPMDDGAIDIFRNGKPQYCFYDDPVELVDFRQTLWWYRTNPRSPFLTNLFCSLPLPGGWVSLRDDMLTLTTGREKRTEKLPDDAAVLAAYDKWFGIKLDERPTPSPHMTNTLRFSFEED